MTDIAPMAPSFGTTAPSLRPLLRGLLIAAGVGLWLLCLPVLLNRTGLVPQEHDCRIDASYRDPVTGRTAQAGHPGPALVPCPSAAP